MARADALARLSQLALVVSGAEHKVHRASEARRALPPGSSRSRVTTANARYATACEARDRTQSELVEHLRRELPDLAVRP
jgi:hypothetical protein